jgi:integrase
MYLAIDAENARMAADRASSDPERSKKWKGRRPVGAASKHRINSVLSAAIEDARTEQLCELNVARLVKLPKARRPKAVIWTAERTQAFWADYQRRITQAKTSGQRVNGLAIWLDTPHPKVAVWTPQQTTRFLTQARKHRLYLLYRMIALLGLRRGEACGLPITEIDLTAKKIGISTELLAIGWDIEEDDTKSEASDRFVVMDDQTAHLIQDHLQQRQFERQEQGPAWIDTGYLFTQENGDVLHPAWVSDQFSRLAYEAGLPPIRLHDLRHGTATHGLSAGIDIKVIQEILGHSTVSVTADTYTSVDEELQRQATNAIAKLLDNPPQGD